MKRLAPALVLLVLAATAAGEERVHVVQPGESLAQIAVRTTGKPGCWEEIYRANRDQIKDPSRLHPGQRLVIPEPLSCTAPEPADAGED